MPALAGGLGGERGLDDRIRTEGAYGGLRVWGLVRVGLHRQKWSKTGPGPEYLGDERHEALHAAKKRAHEGRTRGCIPLPLCIRLKSAGSAVS